MRVGLLLLLNAALGQAVKLESADALAFGPPGILLVGDSISGTVTALDTGDVAPSSGTAAVSIEGIDLKLAALLGVKPGDIRIHDLKVNPLSKNAYLAVARGRGPDAIPVLVRIGAQGALSLLDTDALPATQVQLPGLPDSRVGRRRSRALVITEVQYSVGQVIVAGLSNEDFSSTLRVLPYPFRAAGKGASVEIYHTSHFTYETSSPVRTMVPYTSGGEQFLLAAYTCTPLVKLRLSDLKDGARVSGETLAELGRHSSPVDMILYQKRGADFLLVANTLHGVMKIALDGFESWEGITDAGGNDSQVPRERVQALRSVVQMDRYDETRALLLFDLKIRLDLRLAALP
jgi:hypothetical protein